MRIQGQRCICDRCGREVFQRLIGAETRYGGYEFEIQYEEPEVGWKMREDVGLLCPECNESYHRVMNDFMSMMRSRR